MTGFSPTPGTAPGIRLLAPVEANEIFAEMAPEAMDVLEKEGIRFFRRGPRLARFVCRWDTSDAEIRALVGDEKAAAGRTGDAAAGGHIVRTSGVVDAHGRDSGLGQIAYTAKSAAIR